MEDYYIHMDRHLGRNSYKICYYLMPGNQTIRPDTFEALRDGGFIKVTEGQERQSQQHWVHAEQDSEHARLAAERLADRNRRWLASIVAAMEIDGFKAVIELPINRGLHQLAAVFDAIAAEASGGEIQTILQR